MIGATQGLGEQMDWAQHFQREEQAAIEAARILGDASAAKQALADLKRRRDEGQDAVIWKDAGRWFVGPRPPAEVFGVTLGGKP